jgi:hypothetical protein
MRRLLRDILPITSTVIAVVALFLSARSFKHRNESWEFSTLHAHYTVFSADGYIQVMGPPPSVGGFLQVKAWNALKRLRNDQIQFTAKIESDPKAGSWGVVEAVPKPGTAAAELEGIPFNTVCVVLMRGLDSPQKFAVANYLLYRTQIPMWFQGRDISTYFEPARQSNEVRFGAFELRIAPLTTLPSATQQTSSSPAPELCSVTLVGIDSSGRDELRRSWHQRLDVQTARFSYAWIIVPMLILPLQRLPSLWRSRLRRRQGRCGKCGYDLRFSPDRCPECGATCGRV